MDEQEAIRYILEMRQIEDEEPLIKAYELAIDALEKQIPMRLSDKYIDIGGIAHGKCSCDGCGIELPLTQDSFKLKLKTDRFYNSTGMDYLENNFEFCAECANNIQNSLMKIAQSR